MKLNGDNIKNQAINLNKNGMRKIVATMNITLDGFCDHTAIIPDEEMHEHYAALLDNAGAVLYGRTTYQLMEYWRPIVKKPTGQKATDDFAIAINNVPKIVFSRTLKNVDWETAKLANKGLKEEVLELKQSGDGRRRRYFSRQPRFNCSLNKT